jgi:hypothetical protein
MQAATAERSQALNRIADCTEKNLLPLVEHVVAISAARQVDSAAQLRW